MLFRSLKNLVQTLPKKSVDCVIMVDCAQPKRISDGFADFIDAKKGGTLVCIDHHLLDKPVGNIDWIDPKAASTGCVIWDLLKKLKLKPTSDAANLIYCTLTVDTGSFRYSNTTPSVFRLAAELLEEGADPWFVASHLEESNPPNRFVLLKAALGSLHVGFGGQYASMDVTQKMLQEAKADADLSDDFANYPRSIAGVEVSGLFRELGEGRVKVSLRSKKRVDVSNVAKQFGGGGHKHAAGCVLQCGLEEAKQEIEKVLQKHLK